MSEIYSDRQLQGILLLLILFGLLLYIRFLRKMRQRIAAERAAAQPRQEGFSDTELDRYARHIVLRELGGAGQMKLNDAKVLVVGAGGLGAPVLLYLAAAGVGTIGVVDDDTVSISNLQRQVLFGEADLDMPKVFAAERRLKDLNPFVTIKPYNRRVTADIAETLFADYDLILDGTDSFETRQIVNAAAVAYGKPLLSGAISQWEGQLALFDPARGGPCYTCIFPNPPAPGQAPSCAEAGVIGPLPGIIGSMMGLEAVKHIAGIGDSLRGKMMIYDGLYGESRTVNIKKNPDCPVCGLQER